LFTPRQLVALTTFSDLVGEARERAHFDARNAGRAQDEKPLHASGLGVSAYADAVATYLAFALNKLSTRSCTQTAWYVDRESTMAAFGRQAIPMIWDYAEMNTLLAGSGSFENAIEWESETIERLGFDGDPGHIANLDAATNGYPTYPVVVSSDPPYYDNIGYADLSDFFYVWLRRSLSRIWPDLFRRLTTPKDQELVATPFRHGGKAEAEEFFMRGMSDALKAMRKAATDSEPLVIYYAFKQSEASVDGVTSAGWASFLQAVVDAGLAVDGTWPMRTEQPHGLRVLQANALASSVVLVCRKRGDKAPVVTRAEFLRALKREMPNAIEDIRNAGIGPVDMQQSVIGPGMGVFTRYAKVLESDDSPMSVKTSLSLINRVWEDIKNELDANFDPETQVALAWFASYGYETKKSGELISLANAKAIPNRALFDAGVFKNLHGSTRLTKREELSDDWSPTMDRPVTIWECAQHTVHVLNAPDGGGEAAARLVAQMGAKAADARKLAYRLYEISSQKGWSQEALVYNQLAQEWTHLEYLAASAGSGRAEMQASLQF
jgi:putative DNA methylase